MIYLMKKNLIIKKISPKILLVQSKKFMNIFLIKLFSYILKNYSKNIVFSGGCALNSSANLILTENKNYFQDVFINYAPGDNGGAIGAALIVAHKYHSEIKNIKTPYLGSEYNDEEIKKILENKDYKKKFTYKFYKNDSEFFKLVAKLISEDNYWLVSRKNGIWTKSSWK